MNKLFLCVVFFASWAEGQEKKPVDVMHDPRLYFNLLPQNAKTIINEYLFHFVFLIKPYTPPFLIKFSPQSFAKIVQLIKTFGLVDAHFLNKKDQVNVLFATLCAANYSPHMSCAAILATLHELLPEAQTPELSKDVLIFGINERFYSQQELDQGLDANRIKMCQEYFAIKETQHIKKLYLSGQEMATWKLRQLMKPSFHEEHKDPYEIHISRKKDASIAPEVAQALSEGASAGAYCYEKFCFLTCAATWRMPLVVELLLKAGAHPNEGAALWWAKGARVTKLLLAAGANPNIKYDGANPNIKYDNGKTALFPDPSWAPYSSVAKTRLLLQAGADPNIDRSKHGFPGSPLTACLCRLKKPENRIPLIETLLDGGADRTMRVTYYNNEVTAEDIARSCGMNQVVELLSKPRKIA